MSETQALLDDLLRQVRARMHEVDIEVEDLDDVALFGGNPPVMFRHGMATAFHEVEHLLEDVQKGLPDA